ncbi:DUF2818 family protein [Undibacterium sp. TC4M20W]|uniref:DUF2818 family protein n=1 Tax=Undibacterium sp. TC4M20W TaxID=3413052 RepID=UPI003BF3A943
MGNSASTWLIIVLAVLAANLPFLNERCFAIIGLQRFAFLKSIFFWKSVSSSAVDLTGAAPGGDDDHVNATPVVTDDLPVRNIPVYAEVPQLNAVQVKSLWVRLLELIILYFCVGGIAAVLESSAGNRFPQGWEFYAINACLFLVLAFPGFVYRYLKRNHG